MGEAWNNLGNVLDEGGDLEAAARAYERAVAMRPEEATYHLNHASVLARLGDASAAIDHLAAALELSLEVERLLQGYEELVPLLGDPALRRFRGSKPS